MLYILLSIGDHVVLPAIWLNCHKFGKGRVIPELVQVGGCMNVRARFCREMKAVLARVGTEDSIWMHDPTN